MTTSQPSRQQATTRNSRYSWREAISQLKMYKEKKGHCNVPSTYSNNMQLARYVQNRRLNFRLEKEGLRVNHVLRREERVALEALEFDFELPNYTGKRKYYENQDLLIKYRNKTGNCNVPTRYPEDQELADWCTDFRTNRVKVGKDRRKRLQDIGFNFDVTNISGGRTEEVEDEAITSGTNADNSLCAQKENSNPNPNPNETAMPTCTSTGRSARPSSLSSVTPASLSMASSKPASRMKSNKKGSSNDTNKSSTTTSPTTATRQRSRRVKNKPSARCT